MSKTNLFIRGGSKGIGDLEGSKERLKAMLEAEEDKDSKQVRIKNYAYELASQWCAISNETVSSFITKAVIKELINKIEEEVKDKESRAAMMPWGQLKVAEENQEYNK